ncbi:MAG: MBL fold metallo-hydrolase [Phycisphaerae bacterium]|nr:MBL fold metallo-hydrolase [Phycisphaerae bacterium]
MSANITWIGHASFRLAWEGCVVYIDPWKLPTHPHDADVVFISHSHYDHCSPEDVRHVATDAMEILAPTDTAGKLPSARAITPGETIRIGELTVETVPAYNIGKSFHPKQQQWCGAVFTREQIRVYYAGDTDRIPEMNELQNVDVALLPVGGTYTLDAKEAAEVCRTMSPRLAIPYHWGDIVGSQTDAQRFADAAGGGARILQPGETITV